MNGCLAHSQRISIFEQRNAAIGIGELLNQRAENPIPGTIEPGDKFDLLLPAYFANEILKKVLMAAIRP